MLSRPVRFPRGPWKITCTRSGPLAPTLRAKKRTQGSRRLIGNRELSAVAPGPSWSACVPGPETFHGSLAATTDVFPVSVHAVVPFSKPRFGKAQYASKSAHFVKGYDFAPHEGRSERPAEAAGTANPAAATSAATTSHNRLPLPLIENLASIRRNTAPIVPARRMRHNHSAGGLRSLERGFLRPASSTPGRCADLCPVAEAIPAGAARTTEDAVPELQRES